MKFIVVDHVGKYKKHEYYGVKCIIDPNGMIFERPICVLSPYMQSVRKDRYFDDDAFKVMNVDDYIHNSCYEYTY